MLLREPRGRDTSSYASYSAQPSQLAAAPSILPAPSPLAVVEGNATENTNKTGVRLWTDPQFGSWCGAKQFGHQWCCIQVVGGKCQVRNGLYELWRGSRVRKDAAR